MSRPVRIREHLAAEVERLAKEERRSLANMVEILLEQALKLEMQPTTETRVTNAAPVRIESQVTTTPRAQRRAEDPHFKPDFKK